MFWLLGSTNESKHQWAHDDILAHTDSVDTISIDTYKCYGNQTDGFNVASPMNYALEDAVRAQTDLRIVPLVIVDCSKAIIMPVRDQMLLFWNATQTALSRGYAGYVLDMECGGDPWSVYPYAQFVHLLARIMHAADLSIGVFTHVYTRPELVYPSGVDLMFNMDCYTYVVDHVVNRTLVGAQQFGWVSAPALEPDPITMNRTIDIAPIFKGFEQAGTQNVGVWGNDMDPACRPAWFPALAQWLRGSTTSLALHGTGSRASTPKALPSSSALAPRPQHPRQPTMQRIQEQPTSPKLGLILAESAHSIFGGLQAQLVLNPFFESAAGPGERMGLETSAPVPSSAGWSAVKSQLAVASSRPLSSSHPYSLSLSPLAGSSVADPFGAEYARAGAHVRLVGGQYNASFFAGCDGAGQATATFAVTMLGKAYLWSVSAPLACDGSWHQLNLSLPVLPHTGDDIGSPAGLRFVYSGAGSVHMSGVRVTLQTWGRDPSPGALRYDLASAVQAVAPGFFVYPAPADADGDTLAQAWDWASSTGPWHMRESWQGVGGYLTDQGFGFTEAFQWAIATGGQVVLVVNAGLSLTDQASDPQPWVHSALAQITQAQQICASQNVSCLEAVMIGGPGACARWTPDGTYAHSFGLFAAAIRPVFPDLRLIASCQLESHPAPLLDSAATLVSPPRDLEPGALVGWVSSACEQSQHIGADLFLNLDGGPAMQDALTAAAVMSVATNKCSGHVKYICSSSFISAYTKPARADPGRPQTPQQIRHSNPSTPVAPSAAGPPLLVYDSVSNYGSPYYYYLRLLGGASLLHGIGMGVPVLDLVVTPPMSSVSAFALRDRATSWWTDDHWCHVVLTSSAEVNVTVHLDSFNVSRPITPQVMQAPPQAQNSAVNPVAVYPSPLHYTMVPNADKTVDITFAVNASSI
eukprot:gene1603-2844_t